MQIHYCERCGHRVPDEAIASGVARVKSGNVFWCAKCSTEISEPRHSPSGGIARPPSGPMARLKSGAVALPSPSQIAQNRKSGAVMPPPLKAHAPERGHGAGGSEDRAHARRHSAPNTKQEKNEKAKALPLVWIFGGVGVLFLLVAFALVSGSKPSAGNGDAAKRREREEKKEPATNVKSALVVETPGALPKPGWMPDAPGQFGESAKKR